MEKIKLGIIGHGRFGKLVENIIKENFRSIKIIIFDKESNFEEIEDCKILIVCVPISSFEEAILEIREFVKPHTLIVDVCSVKIHPVKVMKKFLPSFVDIIATHPMFGPDSAKDELRGLKIVVCKVRCTLKRFHEINRILRGLGLKVIQMAPEQHDKLIAKSQLFTHMVGRIAEEMNIEPTTIDTESFAKLLEVKRIITNDSLQLFSDMNIFNPFAKQIRQEIITAFKKIEGTFVKGGQHVS